MIARGHTHYASIPVHTDDFDPIKFRDALPDQGVQDALQDAQRRKPVGAKWITHEKRWIEYSPDDSSYESVFRYFNWRIIRDPPDRTVHGAKSKPAPASPSPQGLSRGPSAVVDMMTR
jgi:hypothetical protein